MTQRIQISGGYVGEVSVMVKDRNGSDLSMAGLKIMLLAIGTALPARTDALWKTPSTTEFFAANFEGDGASGARLTLQVSQVAGFVTGKYKAAVQTTVSPLVVPVVCDNEVMELV